MLGDPYQSDPLLESPTTGGVSPNPTFDWNEILRSLQGGTIKTAGLQQNPFMTSQLPGSTVQGLSVPMQPMPGKTSQATSADTIARYAKYLGYFFGAPTGGA